MDAYLVIALVLALALLYVHDNTGTATENYTVRTWDALARAKLAQGHPSIQQLRFTERVSVRLRELRRGTDGKWLVGADIRYLNDDGSIMTKGGKGSFAPDASYMLWNPITGKIYTDPPTAGNIKKLRMAAETMFKWRIMAGGKGGSIVPLWIKQRNYFLTLMARERG